MELCCQRPLPLRTIRCSAAMTVSLQREHTATRYRYHEGIGQISEPTGTAKWDRPQYCDASHRDVSCRYVGGAPGKIDLYVGKEVVRRAIPMDDATNQLIELIKEHDRSAALLSGS